MQLGVQSLADYSKSYRVSSDEVVEDLLNSDGTVQ